MFGASETPYDLRFQLLGIPVRVHPLFWLVAAMLGWQNENIPVVAALGRPACSCRSWSTSTGMA